MWKICAGYWLLLTTLLLTRNPLAWFSGQRSVDVVYSHLEPIAHFLSFAILAFLAMATRRRLSRAWLIAILATYGAATELIQSQIPGRQMQLVDLVQDMTGILVGCALYWTWQRARAYYSSGDDQSQDVWQHPRRREPLTCDAVSDSIAS